MPLSLLRPIEITSLRRPRSSNLCGEFQRLSLWTWNVLVAAAEVGMPLGEEGITEHLMLELVMRCPQRIKVKLFNKKEEAGLGADWEWWFWNGPDGIGCRVQAKKINLAKERFDSLTFGKRGRGQIDNLIGKATDGRLAPLYCLYFSGRGPSSRQTRLYGCSLVPAEKVREIRKKDACYLAPHCAPWHQLVCGGQRGTKTLGEIEDYLANQSGPESQAVAAIRELPPDVQELVSEHSFFGPHESFHLGISPDEPRRRNLLRGIVTIRVGE